MLNVKEIFCCVVSVSRKYGYENKKCHYVSKMFKQKAFKTVQMVRITTESLFFDKMILMPMLVFGSRFNFGDNYIWKICL